MTAGELARELLEYFGPSGEHWVQRRLTNGLSGAEGKRCFHGAVTEIVLGRPQYSDRLDLVVAPFAEKVREQHPRPYHSIARRPMHVMESFNDASTWEEFQAILEKVAAGE